jgi:hypothetical protein
MRVSASLTGGVEDVGSALAARAARRISIWTLLETALA